MTASKEVSGSVHADCVKTAKTTKKKSTKTAAAETK